MKFNQIIHRGIDRMKSFRNNTFKSSYIYLIILFVFMFEVFMVDAAEFATEAGDTSVKPNANLSSGSASFSVPILVPPGRKSLTPNLALNYSSSNKENGWVGVGWNLGLDFIQRSTKHGLDLYGNDFVVNGSKELVRRSDWDGDNGDGYGAKIEEEFTRYRFTGITTGWVATTKDGVEYYYGETAASQTNNPVNANEVFRWNLSRIVDPNGNEIKITYWKDQGQVYLSQIDYTIKNDGTYANTIKFIPDTASRIDTPVSTIAGFPVKTTDRLKYIEVYGNGEFARKYDIEYLSDVSAYTAKNTVISKIYLIGSNDNRQEGARKLLYDFSYQSDKSQDYSRFSLREIGPNGVDFDEDTGLWLINESSGNGPSMLAHIPMNWVEGVGFPQEYNLFTFRGNEVDVTTNSISDTTPGQWLFVNNGDNPELLRIPYAPTYGYEGGYVTFYNPFDKDYSNHENYEEMSLAEMYNDSHSVKGKWLVADLNADGVTDLIHIADDSTANVWLMHWDEDEGHHSATVYENRAITPRRPGTIWSIGDACWRIADVDGDGKQELINFYSNSLYIYFWTGNSFSGKKITNLPSKTTTTYLDLCYATVGDSNGDGKSDIVSYSVEVLPNDYFKYTFYTLMPTELNVDSPSEMTAASCFHIVVSEPYTSYAEITKPFGGDFNGDKKMDVVLLKAGTPINSTFKNARMLYANGDGTYTNENFEVPWDITQSAYKWWGQYCIGDINGDGETDIINAPNTSGNNIEMYVSGGWQTYRLSIIQNDFGAQATLNYKPCDMNYWDPLNDLPDELTLYDYKKIKNINLPFMPQVVDNISVTDGDSTFTTSYEYYIGNYVVDEREFRGFGKVVQYNPDNTRRTTYFYNEDDDDFLKGRIKKAFSEAPPFDEYYYLNRFNSIEYSWDFEMISSDCAFVKLEEKETALRSLDSGKTVENYIYEDTQGQGFVDKISTITSGDDIENITTVTQFDNYGDWLWRKKEETITGSETGLARWTKYDNYDDYGNLKRKTFVNTDPDGEDQVFEYDYYANGNLKIAYDPKMYPMETIYDEATETYPAEIIYADGSSIEREYDYRFGMVKTETDLNDHITEYTYDEFGRSLKINYPDGGQVENIYYDDERPRKIVTKIKEGEETNNGEIVSITIDKTESFDAFGRKIETRTKGLAPVETEDNVCESVYRDIVTTYSYDSAGRQYLVEGPYFEGDDAYPRIEKFYEDRYDPSLPTRTETKDSVHDVITTNYYYREYNGIYHPDDLEPTTMWVITKDSDGYSKIEYKDNLGRLISVYDSFKVTNYEYNAAGDLLFVRSGAYEVEIKYNTLGQKTYMNDPDMGEWHYTYDKNGNLETQTDNKNQIMTFTYDELNRMTSKSYSTTDPTVIYEYDLGINGIGQLYRVSNKVDDDSPYVMTTYNEYDSMGRIISESKQISDGTQDPPVYTTLSAYDVAGRLTSMTYPDEYLLKYYYYPGTGLLEEVFGTTSFTEFAHYCGYDASGQTVDMKLNNAIINHRYNYDPQSRRLTGFTTKKIIGDTTNDSILLQTRGYTYTNAGDISTIYDGMTDKTNHYTYDRHRLVKESTTSGTTPLIAANIEILTAGDYSSTGPFHAVKSMAMGGGVPEEYDYDDNGNMTSGPDFTDPTNLAARTVTYNIDNMPVEITHSQYGTTTIEYDGDGVRAKKSIGSTSIYYVGGHYEIKQDSGVQSTAKYIFANGTRIALVTDGNDVNYFLTDHLGSTTIITDAAGNIVDEREYTPYGMARKPQAGQQAGAVTNYLFTGQELDPETGLYNYNARLYDPVIGVFITPDIYIPDPAFPISFNRYAYCYNNPINSIDPDGHFIHILAGAAIGALLGGTVNAMMGGDFWDGALTGAISGGFFGLAGTVIDSSVLTAGQQAIIHAQAGMFAGSINAAITGGDIGIGMITGGLSGGLAKYFGPSFDSYAKEFIGRTAIGGISGGIGAAMFGGSFGDGFRNGAMTAAYGMLCNDLVGEGIAFMNSPMFAQYYAAGWAFAAAEPTPLGEVIMLTVSVVKIAATVDRLESRVHNNDDVEAYEESIEINQNKQQKKNWGNKPDPTDPDSEWYGVRVKQNKIKSIKKARQKANYFRKKNY